MANVQSIGIAGMTVVTPPGQVRTTLGSCVGVAIYDRVAKIGGLAHVMLPDSSGGKGDRGKFADTAVDWLVDEVVGAGADKHRLTSKITGGASMFGNAVEGGLGARNVEAVKERLSKHSIRLAAEDVGGGKGRRMLLNPATGDVTVQIIGHEARVI